MGAKIKCVLCGLVAVVVLGLASADSLAQCSTCATPTTAFYQPAPVVVAPVRTGWYPGYWMDRTRYAVWGRPRYAASYPTYAAYQPAYSVGYAPATYGYSGYGSGCSTCASYAPACSTCAPSPCTTCARPVTLLRQVTLRPICGCAPACSSCTSASPCGGSCDSCSGGAVTTVTPAVYSAPAEYSAPAAAPCTNCGITTEAAPPAGPAPSTYVPQQQPLQPQPQQPTLSPSDNPAPERTLLNKPANGSAEPTPANEGNGQTGESSANSLEAPQLFNPSDRTAQRSAAPVWNAVYHQEAAADSQQLLEADAAGWTSASN